MKKGIVVLSLFDGMSCGRIALDRAGIKVKKYYASEIDKYAQIVSAVNYPDIIRLGDVTKWREWKIEKPDIIIGGSPCQGFSFAGKQLNFEDERSKLFFVFIEINSALVSAQNRRRLYWTNIEGVTQPENRGILLKNIIERERIKSADITTRFYTKRPGTLAYTKARANIRKISQKSKTLTGGGQSISNTGATNLFITDKYIRRLTAIECERLQTVPDNFTNHVSNTQRYKMLGNGWTIDVIAHIFRGLK